jgi:cytochrome c6
MWLRVVMAAAVVLLVGALISRASEPKAIFAQRCATCHGADGKAHTELGAKLGAPDITAVSLSEAEIVAVIESGRRRPDGHSARASSGLAEPPKMTPFKGKLSEHDVRALAHFVKNGLR